MRVPVRFFLENELCDAYKVEGAGSSAIHGHHHFLLTLIVRGEGIQTLNGEAIPFAPGDLFLLSPADFHENTVKDAGGYDYYGVKFPYELLDARLAAGASLASFPIHVRLPAEVAARAEAIFSSLVDECAHTDRTASDVMRRCLVEELFVLALRSLPHGDSFNHSAFMNRALGYLHSHFFESITVADAAAYTGYTPNYFNMLFGRAFGIPFGEYLRKMRLSYARNLLSLRGASVTEAAAESGFVSLSHFSRAFRAEFGESPQQYKKKAHP